ncbi:MAG: DUF1553 domain-containing protein [Planctomycetes bacterium]|nr:DUF1553 domain-containing protein [Planctomycetota bacterium]
MRQSRFLPRSGCASLLAFLGAIVPAAIPAAPAGKAARLWSLEPLARPPVPAVKDAGWCRSPIDAFVLEKLEPKGLAPAPEASKGTLLRRASLDLTGLLPEPEEVDELLADPSPDAYERAIDRLLASPRHGERWARHWLDVARYAESEGFKSDEVRPNAWRYRDYVIRAFNADVPYDRFVQEQIAGDELWPADPEARVATAFNRHYPDESNARDLLQRRQEILNDITDTVAAAFTGLTFGCARCHDHKHDPILQRDYYALQAFFANVRAEDEIPLVPEGDLARHRERLAAWEDATREVRAQLETIEEPKRREIAKDNLDKFPPEIQAAIAKAPAERTPLEQQMYHKALPYLNPDQRTEVGALKEDARKRWQALEAELGRFSHLHPGELPLGTGVVDAGPAAPPTHVLAGGAHAAKGEEVEPGYPAVLRLPAPAIEAPRAVESTGRRSALARWLADPRNPLAARVMANRLWHHHFGRGIAGTPNDLGSLGEAPTHPELLDGLAADLIEGGWSLKRLHRAIVTSSAYRQSSAPRGDAAEADPEGRLLGRYPRSRLEGEAIRDAALQAAGLLDLQMGGPSVLPELPAGMDSHGKWSVSKDPADRSRRSVYVFVRRNLRYPFFQAFDAPDTHESCGRRLVTTTAPQALVMLNDRLVLEWARAFSRRVRGAAGPSAGPQVDIAYHIAYSRSPEPDERDMALRFLDARQDALAAGGLAPEEAAGGALADLCHVLLSSNELVYRS